MGPSPSPRHGLTMTAVNHRLIVLGGDNDTSKMEDSSSIYILDSTKIKYPTDTPPQQQSIDSTNNERMYHQQQQQQQQQQQPQQQFDSASIESMNGYAHQSPQQQQLPQQYQQQYQYQQGSQVPQQQQQLQQQQQQQPQQGSYSPQQQHQTIQKPHPDQRQTQRLNPPSSPQQQQQPRSLVGTVMNTNGVHKEIDTTMSYSDVQPSPTNSSPISTSSRHKSFYPEQSNVQVCDTIVKSYITYFFSSFLFYCSHLCDHLDISQRYLKQLFVVLVQHLLYHKQNLKLLQIFVVNISQMLHLHHHLLWRVMIILFLVIAQCKLVF